jgi:hypothetical protein
VKGSALSANALMSLARSSINSRMQLHLNQKNALQLWSSGESTARSNSAVDELLRQKALGRQLLRREPLHPWRRLRYCTKQAIENGGDWHSEVAYAAFPPPLDVL